jgi:hypothetical protein
MKEERKSVLHKNVILNFKEMNEKKKKKKKKGRI